MTNKIFFITGNKNKFAEVSAVLPNVEQLEIDLVEIQEIDSRKIIEHKLIEALKFKKGEFIVEDTSLYLDCLNGLPGPLIKWFLQELGNEGIYKIAKLHGNFGAKAKTIIGYAKNSKEIKYFEGVVEGEIVAPSGKTNFGWDPIFKPKGQEKTFQEMMTEEKNKISMRRIAVNELKKYLELKK